MNPPDAPPPLPHAAPERPFAAPWEAEAFALVVALHEAGVLVWPDWATALGAALEGGATDGSDYHACWLAALEGVVAERGLATRGELAALAAAWQRAARATPHGQPIRLENDPGAD